MIVSLFRRAPRDLQFKIVSIGVLIVIFNVAAWAWALLAFRDFPLLIGTAVLAYSFGLRHAVDVDHIAAIDNVIRKMMQEGKRPVSVGLFFSLGHSTVVFALSVVVALTTTAIQDRFDDIKAIGGPIGTGVSAFFLLAIAAANVLVLSRTYRTFNSFRGGGSAVEDLNTLLVRGGIMERVFRQLFRLMSRSWHMYPLGFLFGLGFDTATEVSVLAISATSASSGMSLWSVLVFPALFSAGMALIDTADGILMLGAYGWAFVKPIRKLYYNLTITTVSVVAALLVGGMEVLGLVASQWHLQGVFWSQVANINGNLGIFGYLLVATFAIGWLVSFAVYRLWRLEEINAAS